MNNQEKNILIELTEQQKIDIEMICTKCAVKSLKKFANTDTPDTFESGLDSFSDTLKSELATITFNHLKELADKDVVIQRLLNQAK